MRALKSFVARDGGILVRVRLFPTAKDVQREFRRTSSSCVAGETVCGFFEPSQGDSFKYAGTIVLPIQGRLIEWVTHEVTHAVIHHLGGVLPSNDEPCCYAVGRISAQIMRRIERLRKQRL